MQTQFFHAKAQIFDDWTSALKHNYFTALLLFVVYAELMYNY